MTDHHPNGWRLLEADNPVPTEAMPQLERSYKSRVTAADLVSRAESGSRGGTTLWRPSHIRLTLAVAVALLAVAIAVPAFAFGLVTLPFSSAEKAPAEVQVDFAEMNTGAPPGMDPRAIQGEARTIETVSIAGANQTLWVAPTEQGGFCFEWGNIAGGCNPDGHLSVSVGGRMGYPNGVEEPKVPADGTPEQQAAGFQTSRKAAIVPLYVAGYSTIPGTESARIVFKDGSTEGLSVTWISEPINAGFFYYEAPSEKRTASRHAIAIEAISGSGSVLDQEPLSSDR